MRKRGCRRPEEGQPHLLGVQAADGFLERQPGRGDLHDAFAWRRGRGGKKHGGGGGGGAEWRKQDCRETKEAGWGPEVNRRSSWVVLAASALVPALVPARGYVLLSLRGARWWLGVVSGNSGDSRGP